MASPQMFPWAEVFLIVAAVCCFARLTYLRLVSAHPAFVLFLVSQIATAVFTQLTGTGTPGYAYAYLVLVALEWIAYGWMISELYTDIFTRFPGIAKLGQWSVYGASAVTLLIIFTGLLSAREKVHELRTLLVAIEFASRCLLFGYAALIIIILIVVSRYPLELLRNTLTISIVFSIILLGETSALITDQLTSRHYTIGLNSVINALGGICMTFWAFALSHRGEVAVYRLRRDYNLSDEIRLLNQLSVINTILIRSGRK